MLLLDSQWGKRVCKGSLDPLLIPSSHAKFSLLAKQWKRVGRKCIIIAWSLPNIFSEINHRRKKGMCVPILFLLMTVLPRIAMVWMSVIECALFASERSSRQLSAILSIRPTWFQIEPNIFKLSLVTLLTLKVYSLPYTATAQWFFTVNNCASTISFAVNGISPQVFDIWWSVYSSVVLLFPYFHSEPVPPLELIPNFLTEGPGPFFSP